VSYTWSARQSSHSYHLSFSSRRPLAINNAFISVRPSRIPITSFRRALPQPPFGRGSSKYRLSSVVCRIRRSHSLGPFIVLALYLRPVVTFRRRLVTNANL